MSIRPISMSVPLGKLKLTLWAGTEDEQSFLIREADSERPYVNAYGIKYYLTKEEIKALHQLQKLI